MGTIRSHNGNLSPGVERKLKTELTILSGARIRARRNAGVALFATFYLPLNRSVLHMLNAG